MGLGTTESIEMNLPTYITTAFISLNSILSALPPPNPYPLDYTAPKGKVMWGGQDGVLEPTGTSLRCLGVPNRAPVGDALGHGNPTCCYCWQERYRI